MDFFSICVSGLRGDKVNHTERNCRRGAYPDKHAGRKKYGQKYARTECGEGYSGGGREIYVAVTAEVRAMLRFYHSLSMALYAECGKKLRKCAMKKA